MAGQRVRRRPGKAGCRSHPDSGSSPGPRPDFGAARAITRPQAFSVATAYNWFPARSTHGRAGIFEKGKVQGGKTFISRARSRAENLSAATGVAAGLGGNR